MSNLKVTSKILLTIMITLLLVGTVFAGLSLVSGDKIKSVTEIIGSDFESDITKRGVETEVSHDFLFSALAGDSFIFQFIADDADVRISTHGTFGDHPESATIVIKKVANL